jgi:hypothetical protein
MHENFYLPRFTYNWVVSFMLRGFLHLLLLYQEVESGITSCNSISNLVSTTIMRGSMSDLFYEFGLKLENSHS